MAIPEYVRKNYRTLLAAADDGNVAVMEIREGATGKTVYALAAVGRDDGGFFEEEPDVAAVQD